jgi:DNA mismatch repair protein MutL
MERVRYEYYQEKLLSQQTPVQDFLIPLVIDDRKVLIPRIDEINDVFKDFQIQLELLTEDSFIIRSVPTWIKHEEVHEFINDILDQFEAEDTIREEDMRRMTLATLACHSSVRFNEYMSMIEMETLVSQLRSCKQPFNCPHGRPTFITVEHKQLIKEFKR